MDLSDKSILLTGATSGIGRATALALAPSAGLLLIHGPEPRDAVTRLIEQVELRLRPGCRSAYLQADYQDLGGVPQLAERVLSRTERLDLLINNASRAGAPTRVMSSDGNELTLQVNYLAPVALTSLLLERMRTHGGSRIVNISSATHLSATLRWGDLDLADGYSPTIAYAQSKLAIVTYSCWLAARLPAQEVEVVSMHPGVVSTGLLHAMFGIHGEPPAVAADRIVVVAARSGDSGSYYDEVNPAAPNSLARDPEVQSRLHRLTAARLDRVASR